MPKALGFQDFARGISMIKNIIAKTKRRRKEGRKDHSLHFFVIPFKSLFYILLTLYWNLCFLIPCLLRSPHFLHWMKAQHLLVFFLNRDHVLLRILRTLQRQLHQTNSEMPTMPMEIYYSFFDPTKTFSQGMSFFGSPYIFLVWFLLTPGGWTCYGAKAQFHGLRSGFHERCQGQRGRATDFRIVI